MNPLTLEWIRKAEADWNTACREFDVMDEANYDAVCFHAQQCAEKYVKALLKERGFPVPRTHDLVRLIDSLMPKCQELGALTDDLEALTAQAVDVRYPGVLSDQTDARAALEAARKTRHAIRGILKLA